LRGEHTLIGWHAVFVELVEVRHQRFVRLAVLPLDFGMANPDAEHEAARMGGVDAMERLGDGFGGGRPDVDDPGGHLQGGRRFQKWLDERQLGRRRTTDPNRAVTQPFDSPSLIGAGADSEEAKSAEVGGGGF